MKILPDFNLETIRSVLEKDFPELEIRNIILFENGWDNVVADVNGEHIFRFPKNKEVKIELEIKVLDYLKNKISTQIPEVTYYGKSYDYYGYPKIQGVGLSDEIYNSMSEREKNALAYDLSTFLYELHSVISIDVAREFGTNEKMIGWYFDNANELKDKFIFDPEVSVFVSRVVDDFERLFKESTDLVFLHNDLHDNNMAINYESKKLIGVFDFSDISIGDRNFDFTPMCRFCTTDLTRRIIDKYETVSGVKLDWQKIKTYAYIWEISDVAEYIGWKDGEIYKKGMARIKKWLKEDLIQQ